MARRRVARSPSFAEFLAQPSRPGEGSGQPLPIVNLAAEASFTDDSGVVWRRRGGEVTGKHLWKLLGDPSVRVLYDYLGETREVPPRRREEFSTTAQERMRQSEHSDFVGGEFRNDLHGRLLVIHEYC